MNVIGPREIGRVLAIVDDIGIHREAVRVPLGPVPGGSVRIEGAAVVLELPTEGLDAWLEGLPARIRALPGAESLRPADDG